MIAIWKFPLPLSGAHEILMPKETEILCAQNQNDKPTIWALVDTDKPAESRLFRVELTGFEVTGSMDLGYIGTVQLNDGGYVVHVFEEYSDEQS